MSKDSYLYIFDTIINSQHIDYYLDTNKKIKLLQECLDFGIDINHNNSRALIKAIENDDIKIVRFLIDNGINIRANDDLALITACGNDNIDDIETIKLLLSLGADPNAQNNKPLSISISDLDNIMVIEVVKLLIDSGADPFADPNLLSNACSTNYLLLVEYLLSIGIKCSDSDICYVFKLHIGGSFPIKKLLLDNEANPNAKYDNGLFLLEYNIIYDGFNEIKLLLEYGADVNLCYNIINRTPFFKSEIKYRRIGSIKRIAELLFEYGLDISWLSERLLDI